MLGRVARWWTLTWQAFGSLGEVVRRSGNAAPGPHGVPWAGWRRASPSARFLLLDVTAGVRPSVWFGDTRMVFIPKVRWSAGSGRGEVATAAADWRPLSLSWRPSPTLRCGRKRRSVANAQCGCVAGLHFSDGVLLPEAPLLYGVRRSSDGGCCSSSTALLDVRNHWLEEVLEHMRLQAPTRRLLDSMYKGTCAAIFMGAAAPGTILVRSGIRQGCPGRSSHWLSLFRRSSCVRTTGKTQTMTRVCLAWGTGGADGVHARSLSAQLVEMRRTA